MRELLIGLFIPALLAACSTSTKISHTARNLINDSATRHSHLGISIFEPATGRSWYRYNDEKYFVPASNTKLFTLYAGLKYLGDSLPTLGVNFTKDTVFLTGMGDPSFMQPEFLQQPALDFLQSLKLPIALSGQNWREDALGYGWSWDDYESSDMVERSPLPVYNNLISFEELVVASFSSPFSSRSHKYYTSIPRTSWPVEVISNPASKGLTVSRLRSTNVFKVTIGEHNERTIQIPFVTDGINTTAQLLKEILKTSVSLTNTVPRSFDKVIYSRPSDSLFTIMMHRSDNFFAEQTLLMASNIKLGYMNDKDMIRYLEVNDLRTLPQKPVWVDGSGLSRYNLFTPADFVYLLNKLKNDFGLERLQKILPTGGTGTLRSLYRQDSGYIFAKTGTLSNHVALSGFLITKQKKLLIFSILANNLSGNAPPVRKAIEKFLSGIRQHY